MKYSANTSGLIFKGPCSLTVETKSIGCSVPEATLTFLWTTENISRLYGEISGESIAPKKLIFNDPATIVYWQDGTRTVVKCQEGTEFNPYHGFCAALAKKIFGNNSAINRMVENAEVHKTAAKKEKPDAKKQKTEAQPKPERKKCSNCVYLGSPVRDEPCHSCMNTEGDHPNFVKVETHYCRDCKYEDKKIDEEPCVNCLGFCRKEWKPKEGDSPKTNKSEIAAATDSTEVRSCMNCKYGDVNMWDEPCQSCIDSSESKWEPEEGD